MRIPHGAAELLSIGNFQATRDTYLWWTSVHSSKPKKPADTLTITSASADCGAGWPSDSTPGNVASSTSTAADAVTAYSRCVMPARNRACRRWSRALRQAHTDMRSAGDIVANEEAGRGRGRLPPAPSRAPQRRKALTAHL